VILIDRGVADSQGAVNAPAFTGSWSTARQPPTGQEPLSVVPARAGRSGRPPAGHRYRAFFRQRRLGPSMRSVAELPGASPSRAQKIPRYLLCVSGGRLPGEPNPASRGPSHPVHGPGSVIIATPRNEPLTCNATEPPIGIEPMTYPLREARSPAAHPLAAQIAPIIAPTALAAPGLSKDPVHEPAHARGLCVTPSCSLCAARHASPG
jgi:hypothetical protein